MRGTATLSPRRVRPLSCLFWIPFAAIYGETDDIYTTSGAFSTLPAPACHLAPQFCCPATTLASSTHWISRRLPAGSPGPRYRISRDATPVAVLLSWHAAPLCRCAGRTALGRRASHLCHSAQPARPRL